MPTDLVDLFTYLCIHLSIFVIIIVILRGRDQQSINVSKWRHVSNEPLDTENALV